VELRFTKGGSVHSRVGRDCWDMRIINRLGCVLWGTEWLVDGVDDPIGWLVGWMLMPPVG